MEEKQPIKQPIKKYDYKDHKEIPLHISLYILEVADVDSIEELAIEDINSFLNGQEEWLMAGEEDDLFEEVEQIAEHYRSYLVH